MPILEAQVDRLYVVRMDTTVDRLDVDRIIRGAETAAKAAGGQIVYCGINGPSFEPPSAEVREYIVSRSTALLRCASSLEIVLEGDGIKATLLRSVVRGIIAVARTRGATSRKTHLHATVHAALERVQGELTLPVATIESRLGALGLLGDRAAHHTES